MNKMGKWRQKEDRGPACGDVEGLETPGYGTCELEMTWESQAIPMPPMLQTGKLRPGDGKGLA